jgi:hypothetical protein
MEKVFVTNPKYPGMTAVLVRLHHKFHNYWEVKQCIAHSLYSNQDYWKPLEALARMYKEENE